MYYMYICSYICTFIFIEKHTHERYIHDAVGVEKHTIIRYNHGSFTTHYLNGLECDLPTYFGLDTVIIK